MKFENIIDQTELFFSIFDNLMVQAVLWNDLSFLFKNVLNMDILIGLFKVYLFLLHIIWFFDYFMVQTTLRCENILSFYEILKYEFMRALWTIFFRLPRKVTLFDKPYGLSCNSKTLLLFFLGMFEIWTYLWLSINYSFSFDTHQLALWLILWCKLDSDTIICYLVIIFWNVKWVTGH